MEHAMHKSLRATRHPLPQRTPVPAVMPNFHEQLKALQVFAPPRGGCGASGFIRHPELKDVHV
jgi:hypothetical protein